jgi:hypothetical protein
VFQEQDLLRELRYSDIVAIKSEPSRDDIKPLFNRFAYKELSQMLLEKDQKISVGKIVRILNFIFESRNSIYVQSRFLSWLSFSYISSTILDDFR